MSAKTKSRITSDPDDLSQDLSVILGVPNTFVEYSGLNHFFHNLILTCLEKSGLLKNLNQVQNSDPGTNFNEINEIIFDIRSLYSTLYL